MASPEREYEPVPMPAISYRGEEPCLVGVIGPPGSGKTRSILRMMRGVQRVRSGPIVLIDTEAGRSKKFSPEKGQPADPARGTYDFLRIDLDPPFRADRCLDAIRQALKVNPAAVGFDNLSDEHLGEGGYLEWHESEIPKMGGNEYGAWAKPAAARKRLASAISHTAVPMFFTFIAQEKTEQVDDPKKAGKKKIVQLGWMPVAPMLLVKVLDLTCILPYDSKGTPVWKSRDLPGEDFIRKWPDYLVSIMKEGQLTEDHGEALARWAKGDAAQGSAPVPDRPASGQPAGKNSHPDEQRRVILDEVAVLLGKYCSTKEQRQGALEAAFGTFTKAGLSTLPLDQLAIGRATLGKQLEGLAAMAAALPFTDPAEREPGEDS